MSITAPPRNSTQLPLASGALAGLPRVCGDLAWCSVLLQGKKGQLDFKQHLLVNQYQLTATPWGSTLRYLCCCWRHPSFSQSCWPLCPSLLQSYLEAQKQQNRASAADLSSEVLAPFGGQAVLLARQVVPPDKVSWKPYNLSPRDRSSVKDKGS